jgi:retinol dehydrogenase 13
VTFHPYKKTCDGYETHLQVNYLGHFLLTYLLLPMILKSKQSRIINVSAHAYSTGNMAIDDPLNISNIAPKFHCRDAFSHSKLAVVLWTRKLAKILKAQNVSVNCLTPGLVRGTKHMRHSPLMKAFSMRLIMFPCMFVFMKTAQMGAQTAIYLASDEKVKNTSGAFFK